MRMIREILRLFHQNGVSQKKISRSLGCARSSVADYLKRAQAAGLSWPLPPELEDEELLEKHLFGPPAETARPQPDCDYIHQELKRKGVTLQLLWQEYKEANPNGYQSTQFSDIYRQWRKTLDVSMRLDHKAGEKAFSDFAGATLPIVDPHTNQVTFAHLFVCTLGASNYTFARLFWNETSESWCKGHASAFCFFQGCPEAIVPDYVSRNIIRILWTKEICASTRSAWQIYWRCSCTAPHNFHRDSSHFSKSSSSRHRIFRWYLSAGTGGWHASRAAAFVRRLISA